jgi:hypothetical protein
MKQPLNLTGYRGYGRPVARRLPTPYHLVISVLVLLGLVAGVALVSGPSEEEIRQDFVTEHAILTGD